LTRSIGKLHTIKQTREKVTEGTSALFLLTSSAVLDKVVETARRDL
jgi:uncharacterized membrane protein